MSSPPAAEPMPNVYRAQLAIQGRSGLPEDRFVNVFHFRHRTASGSGFDRARDEEMAGQINTKLQSFYRGTTVGGAQHPISTYLSRLALSIVRAVQLRVYHLGDNEPREPIIFDWNLATASPDTTAVLPNEAAACLSIYGTRNIPGERGRVFVGPLGANAIAEDPTRGDLKVAEAFRATLADAGIRLATPTADIEWVVYSPTNADTTRVRNGWIDDALDTQRRRGVRPTGRLSWVVETEVI